MLSLIYAFNLAMRSYISSQHVRVQASVEMAVPPAMVAGELSADTSEGETSGEDLVLRRRLCVIYSDIDDAMRHKTARAYGYATHIKPQGYTSRPPLLTTNKVFYCGAPRCHLVHSGVMLVYCGAPRCNVGVL